MTAPVSASPTVPGFSEKLKTLHWIVGPIILFLLALGLIMADMDRGAPFRAEFYSLHKSFGIMVLILAFVRLSVRLTSQHPPEPKGHKKWERVLANAVHVFLYIGMFAMPLSGWAMSSAGGRDVQMFGLPVPPLVPENEQIGGFAHTAHTYIAYALIVALALHFAGVLKHMLIDRDDTLLRIIPARWQDHCKRRFFTKRH
jgi:cytochrome b561